MADATINTNSNNYKTGYNAGVTATKVGNATAAQVLTGKTFTNASGVGISGTMANQGAWTNTPTAKGKVTIPAGYHNGSGYVDTSSVYDAGVTAGKPTKTQTVSNTYTMSEGERANPVFTFSNLTTVTGVTSYTNNNYGDFIVYNMKISGNTVTLSTYCDEHSNVTSTITVTAIGY